MSKHNLQNPPKWMCCSTCKIILGLPEKKPSEDIEKTPGEWYQR